MAGIDWFNVITWAVLAAFAGLNLVVLLAGSERGARLKEWGRRGLARLSGRSDLDWLDWIPVWVASVAIFAGVSAYGLLSGQYGCHPPSDAIGLLDSGRAFLTGQNPFTVPGCGSQHEIPYGFAAVLLDALGSFGGLTGIYAVWGLTAFALVPLVWTVAEADRRLVLLFVGSSPLLVPLVSSQIDGATNALVPVTVLLSLYLARRREPIAAAVGGFLSTARFPNVFPLLGATGSSRSRRVAMFALVAGVFLGVTALTYLRWGTDFLGPVFANQLGRRSFSLNFYGILLFANALPSSFAVEAVEGVLTVALVLAVFVTVRSPLGAASIVLVGVALLTPFLSFTILVWLLPVALVGARARWWLWGTALVGSLNYDLALNVWVYDDGITWPSAVLDVVLTALLLALFVELWRTFAPPGRPAREGGSG